MWFITLYLQLALLRMWHQAKEVLEGEPGLPFMEVVCNNVYITEVDLGAKSKNAGAD